MASQIYLNSLQKILEIPKPPNYDPIYKEFYLGDSETYTVLQDNNNSFTSLGGSIASPLIYTYEDTGITEFNINYFSPDDVEGEGGPGYWELWIEGDKNYYYNFKKRRGYIFDRTLSVKCTKGQTTKFKIGLTLYQFYQDLPLYSFYFGGDPEIVYSSITAKFIG